MTAKDNIIKLYDEGIQIKDISDKTKCSISYVYRILRERQIELGNTVINNKCISLLRDTDLSFYLISKELDIPERRVREIAYKNNIREKKKSIW